MKKRNKTKFLIPIVVIAIVFGVIFFAFKNTTQESFIGFSNTYKPSDTISFQASIKFDDPAWNGVSYPTGCGVTFTKFYIDSNLIEERYIGTMYQGDSQTLSFDYTIPSSFSLGSHTAKIRLQCGASSGDFTPLYTSYDSGNIKTFTVTECASSSDCLMQNHVFLKHHYN